MSAKAKIFYFIYSHKNSGQVVRLVETLKSGSPESRVLIYRAYSKSYRDRAVFERMSGVYVINMSS